MPQPRSKCRVFLGKRLSALVTLQAIILMIGADCGQSSTGGVDSGSDIVGSGGRTGGGGSGGLGPDWFPRCGDGRLDFLEACDDGNTTNGDGCNRACQIEANWECPEPGRPCTNTAICGNGRLTSDETCDDGNTAGGDGCAGDCQTIDLGWRCRLPGRPCTPLCGDGHLVGPEECDDSNTLNGDGCSSTCHIEGRIRCTQQDAGSGCDGGVPQVCGDGIVSADEECDDGNDLSKHPYNVDDVYGWCTTECRLGPYCGDSVVNGNEECDLGMGDGAGYGPDGCTTACTTPPFCGDGIVDTNYGEQCDTGTIYSGGSSLCYPDCTMPPL